MARLRRSQIITEHPRRRAGGRLADWYGFHIDPRQALGWLQKVDSPALLLEMVEDPWRADITFLASTQTLSDLCSEAHDAAILADATRLQITLPCLIERMLVGFLDEQGLLRAAPSLTTLLTGFGRTNDLPCSHLRKEEHGSERRRR